MRAIRLTAWEQPAELASVPEPEPGPGEVLLRVAGAGLCHSDLHLMHWRAGTLPYELPFTLGHEVAGTVAALGAGADGIEAGEPVLVYGPWGCGRCRACSVGAEHLCDAGLTARGAGLGRDGGLAEYMVVPSPRLTVPLDGLDPVTAAPLADAGLTPYHAIRRVLPLLRPGTTAIVIGVGGLGHVAVQLLKALSPARVVAVDRREQALEVAARSGADAALPASDLTPAQLRAAAGGRGAAVVVDCVGSDDTLALAAGAVAPGGDGPGIGAAICQRLAADGALVAALDVRLDAARETISAIGAGLAVDADVGDSAAVDEALARVEHELGPVGILVNNAGAVGAAHLGRVLPLLETQRQEALAGDVQTPLDALVRLGDDEWRSLLAVHLDGTFFCTRAAARLMAPRRTGVIVNMASVCGIEGCTGHPHYSAAKAGIIGFTRAVAKELIVQGIRVNAVAPGHVDTSTLKGRLDAGRRVIANQTPDGRLARPEGIA